MQFDCTDVLIRVDFYCFVIWSIIIISLDTLYFHMNFLYSAASLHRASLLREPPLFAVPMCPQRSLPQRFGLPCRSGFCRKDLPLGGAHACMSAPYCLDELGHRVEFWVKSQSCTTNLWQKRSPFCVVLILISKIELKQCKNWNKSMFLLHVELWISKIGWFLVKLCHI